VNKKNTREPSLNARGELPKKDWGRLLRGKELLNLQKRRTRSALTRSATLTRQLSEDLYYASAPSTQRAWDASQCRRSDWSILKKKRETLQLIRSLPEPYDEELLDLTKAIWRAAYVPEPGRGNPATPLIRQQAQLLAEARAELAPTQCAIAAAAPARSMAA
jgi:hypothetical protein